MQDIFGTTFGFISTYENYVTKTNRLYEGKGHLNFFFCATKV